MLQSALGPLCPIQDMFDLAFGTSSDNEMRSRHTSCADTLTGGLIVLGLFLHHWTIDYCDNAFEALARQLFRNPDRESKSIVKRLRNALKCWVSDGCYDAGSLERTLQRQFGGDKKFFGYSDRPAGSKVAVTATMISDAFPIIFSNYNGMGSRHNDSGMILFRIPIGEMTFLQGTTIYAEAMRLTM